MCYRAYLLPIIQTEENMKQIESHYRVIAYGDEHICGCGAFDNNILFSMSHDKYAILNNQWHFNVTCE